MPNSNGAVDLGSLTPEEQEQVEALAAEHPEVAAEKIPVLTAFVVVMTRQGEVQVGNLGMAGDVTLDVEPSPDLMFGMASVVQKDLEAAEVAQTTMAHMAMQARQMQEQIVAQQIASQVQGGLKVGH